MVNTDKLQSFANDLRNVFNKHTDALFIDNLIIAINSHNADEDTVSSWLDVAFDLPKDCDKDNCFDTYNRSFFHQIREKI